VAPRLVGVRAPSLSFACASVLAMVAAPPSHLGSSPLSSSSIEQGEWERGKFARGWDELVLVVRTITLH
jgi:hypothetical protein